MSNLPYGRDTQDLEWILPDVLPGVCRILLRVPTFTHLGLPQPATTWHHVKIDDTGLSVFTVKMALRTPMAVSIHLEAIFLEEPTLDQMDALEDFAKRMSSKGLPALVAGQF
jgi:hypothetical protein